MKDVAGTDAFAFDGAEALARLATGRPVAFPAMETVRAVIEGRVFVFHLNMAQDPIQGRHRVGKFYERAELDQVMRYMNTGAQIVDIGANVGNHALYWATFGRAARVVVVEPNPLAIAPLMANVLGNRLEDVIDLSVLGVGLSDVSAGGYGLTERRRNLGAARMQEAAGEVAVVRGDDLLAEEAPDLVKIDVEGMELKVLSGLERLIARCRPLIFVEIDGENDARFHDWIKDTGYDVVFETKPYAANRNYLIRPQPGETA